ncbi:uncharacterized protein [Nicotiana sylvestris]|uniref:uncharacterized protein n=1 Tax=Nicotiana sylvestris TaxID=4096 RepID=UPI00388C5069
MVRTRAVVSDDVAPRAGIAIGRGRGRRGACIAARAPNRAEVEEPPVAPVVGQVPEAPAGTLGRQETLAQFLSMFGTLAQAWLILPVVRVAASEEEQLRLTRFKKYDPPTFSGLLKEAAYQWWRAYELGSPAESVSLTWVQFSEMFLREFVTQSLRDAWCMEFEQLCQGTISVSEYAIRFSDLARHAPALVATVRERVCRFNEVLRHDIRFSMAWELESDVLF